MSHTAGLCACNRPFLPSVETLEDRLAMSVFFTTTDPVNGNRLWETSGTGPTTHRITGVTRPSPFSNAGNFKVAGGLTYFTAASPAGGMELWETNGTETGTVQVKDINPGPAGSNPANLTPMNGMLYFTANDGTHGTELYKTDGTAAGTSMMADINPGSAASSPSSLAVMGGKLYFAATTSAGRELWVSDGTAAGTRMVVDLNPGSGDSNPDHLAAVGNTLYFTADDGSGTKLFSSDGTAAGTQAVPVIDRNTLQPITHLASIANLTASGNNLFFTADDGQWGNELWVRDSSGAPAYMVRDIAYHGLSSNPRQLTDLNGKLCFLAEDPVNGLQFWRTELNSAGQFDAYRHGTLDFAANPPRMVVAGNQIYFTAAIMGQNRLFTMDNVAGNPTGLHNFGSQVPDQLTADGSSVYFTAQASNGTQIWKTDGTRAGTTLITTGSMVQNLSALPPGLFSIYPRNPLVLQLTDTTLASVSGTWVNPFGF
jgi:ELWxxDGT repeat protein